MDTSDEAFRLGASADREDGAMSNAAKHPAVEKAERALEASSEEVESLWRMLKQDDELCDVDGESDEQLGILAARCRILAARIDSVSTDRMIMRALQHAIGP